MPGLSIQFVCKDGRCNTWINPNLPRRCPHSAHSKGKQGGWAVSHSVLPARLDLFTQSAASLAQRYMLKVILGRYIPYIPPHRAPRRMAKYKYSECLWLFCLGT